MPIQRLQRVASAEPDRCVFQSQRDRAIVTIDRGRVTVEPVQRVTAIGVRAGIVRLQGDGAMVAVGRVLKPIQRLKRHAAIEPRHRIGGVAIQRAIVAGQGFLRPAECLQGIAAAQPISSVIGPQRQGAIVACDRLGMTRQGQQHFGPVGMGLRQGGILLQRQIVAGERVPDPAQRGQHRGAIGIRRGRRSLRQRLVDQGERLGVAALLVPQHTEKMLRVRVRGIARQCLAIQRLGAGEIPRAVPREGVFEGVVHWG